MMMATGNVRIGAFISPNDPFWVQVQEAVYQQIHRLGDQLVPFDLADSPHSVLTLDPDSLVEELLAQELDALVCINLPEGAPYPLLERGLPLIYLGETGMRHPLLVSPRGLYEAAFMAGTFIAEKLGGRGRTIYVSGMLDSGEEGGASRISGYTDALSRFPAISAFHVPAFWRYDQACPLIEASLADSGTPVDAIFGLSDSLALAARDAGRALGVVDEHTLVVGINGDPMALAAIAEGSMTATVETSAQEFGTQAAILAHQAALGEPVPPHYFFTPRLITASNVTELAMQKLVAIANIPTRLVGFSRWQERSRLVQLETSAAISRRVGSLLDRRQMSQEIADLIRANYNYDHVQILLWSEDEQELVLDVGGPDTRTRHMPLAEAGLLGEVLRRNEAIFIPDVQHSHRFSPDPDWPSTRARVVVPIRLGEKTLGLLDLHSRQPNMNLRWEVVGLQALADQLGIAMRNAELYAEALRARQVAEQANQLKTRLLANVSHELRAPLNVIMGYSQAALNTPGPYNVELPAALRRDLGYIYQSGEHLSRIISDLLDLSRAEIGALDLYPEAIDTRPFLEDVFNSMARSTSASGKVAWRLCLPDRLPVIQADTVRLRQILLNLLSNASKFTPTGQITLGAEVEPPYLHVWVEDTGIGIPVGLQERIFEPFVTAGRVTRRREAIGLGLSITRHLVALHGGFMSLESRPERGSVFHVYLPLPTLDDRPALPPAPPPASPPAPPIGGEWGGGGGPPSEQPTLVVLTSHAQPPAEISAMAGRQGLKVCLLRPGDDLNRLLRQVQPAALAWDMAGASANDWQLIQRLRSHAHFSCLPFILFRQAPGAGSLGISMTNVLLKPFAGKSLVELLDSLRPQAPAGFVLIVDDDPQARTLYHQLVTEAWPALTVREAENGAQALALLEDQIPCLILLDLMMPQVDGFAVLEKVRADPRTHQVPVVVMSGKVLTFEDVQRLDYARVTFHTKGLLSSEEAVASLQQSFKGERALCQPTSTLVKYTLAYLHQNYAEDLSRGELANAAGVSEIYLSQIFHQEMGLSLWECLNRLRIQEAKVLLCTGDEPITTIARQVGFGDSAYFSRVFRRIVGQSPRAYRENPSPL